MLEQNNINPPAVKFESSTDMSPLIKELIDLQVQQNNIIIDLKNQVKHIITWLILFMLLSGCNAYQIYTRMGEMRVY